MSKVFNDLPFDLMNIVNQYVFDKKAHFDYVVWALEEVNDWEKPDVYIDSVMRCVMKHYTVSDNGVRHIDSNIIRNYSTLKNEIHNIFLFNGYIHRAYVKKLTKFELRDMLNKEFKIIHKIVEKNKVLLNNKIQCKCGAVITKQNYNYHLDTERHIKLLYSKKYSKLFN